MFSIKNIADDILLPEINERYEQLSEEQKDEFYKIFTDNIGAEALKLDQNELEDDETMESLIKRVISEAMDKVEGAPVDNWKNGLDLL